MRQWKLSQLKTIKFRPIRPIRTYFKQRCDDDRQKKNFYKTVKPFLSGNRSHTCGDKIILREEGSILSKPIDVAEVFNAYYASISQYKNVPDGLDNLNFDEAVRKHASHESILLINKYVTIENEFNFSPISVENFAKSWCAENRDKQGCRTWRSPF